MKFGCVSKIVSVAALACYLNSIDADATLMKFLRTKKKAVDKSLYNSNHLLTPEELADFYKNGFMILRGVVNRDAMKDWRNKKLLPAMEKATGYKINDYRTWDEAGSQWNFHKAVTQYTEKPYDKDNNPYGYTEDEYKKVMNLKYSKWFVDVVDQLH